MSNNMIKYTSVLILENEARKSKMTYQQLDK